MTGHRETDPVAQHYEDVLRMLEARGCEVDKPWMCLAECPDDSTEWCGPCAAHAALTTACS